ncbi:hypothetical protein ADIARSV_0547 [Arcticibacter svalbardensis MN12-7]|uniref:GIY-YIG domain-containing protein n=2 Tax=Arcticibacter TaxID=1288026 RepID=R9GWX3_9SPHI|nr:hypothetical protein ADIARSV_0547 [Arcticibacter svalbardensis MN12-7]
MNLYNELIQSKIHPIPQIGKIDRTTNHGVYIIYGPNDDVLHVGMARSGIGGLNQRLNDHLLNKSSFYRGYLGKKNISLRQNHKFRYLEIEDLRTRALVESLTAGLLCPAHFGIEK